MSLIVTTDIRCDSCGNWTDGVVGPTVDARGARVRAADAGWVRRRRGSHFADLCFRCEPALNAPYEHPGEES